MGVDRHRPSHHRPGPSRGDGQQPKVPRLRSTGHMMIRRPGRCARVRLFVAATITYNVIEAAVAFTAGALASSTALIGWRASQCPRNPTPV